VIARHGRRRPDRIDHRDVAFRDKAQNLRSLRDGGPSYGDGSQAPEDIAAPHACSIVLGTINVHMPFVWLLSP
jgi:hypothetical protein